MEFVEALAAIKDPADEVKLKLITTESSDGPEKVQKQLEFLLRVKQGATAAGITLDVEFSDTIHDRSIRANSAWRINLGRGLDISQFVYSDASAIAPQLQQYRQVKALGIPSIKEPTTNPTA